MRLYWLHSALSALVINFEIAERSIHINGIDFIFSCEQKGEEKNLPSCGVGRRGTLRQVMKGGGKLCRIPK